ncbi:hypothetical protein SOPP22_18260 [Shewanella sp. OPT22]|nr:hypothetical protein SOPP22_18260 [Shewanella sp. OPT22]
MKLLCLNIHSVTNELTFTGLIMKKFFYIVALFSLSFLSNAKGVVKAFDGKAAPSQRLTVIEFPYVDFNGNTKRGSIKTLDSVSEQLKGLMLALYANAGESNFPIRIADYKLADEGKDIDLTYSYAARNISGGNIPSVHAYGAAVDLNVRENPYIHFSDVNSTSDNPIPCKVDNVCKPDYLIPESGWRYISRQKYREGKESRIGINNKKVVDLFKKHGFLRWGGDWNYPIDFQHFEVYRTDALLLLSMYDSAFSYKSNASKAYFDKYVKFYNQCNSLYPDLYKTRNFSNLSRAIAEKYNQLPIDIYTSYSTYRAANKALLKDADEILNNLSSKLCYNLQSDEYNVFSTITNKAIEKMDKINAVKEIDKRSALKEVRGKA